MQYRTTEESQSLIRQWVSEWGTYMGVTQVWHLVLALSSPSKLDSADSAAETSWPTGYRTAKIKFNTKFLNKQSDAELETLVVHELCHLVCAESFDIIDTLFGKGTVKDDLTLVEEKNVDTMARLLLRTKYERFPHRPSELYDNSYPGATGFDEEPRAEEDDSGSIIWDGGERPAYIGPLR